MVFYNFLTSKRDLVQLRTVLVPRRRGLWLGWHGAGFIVRYILPGIPVYLVPVCIVCTAFLSLAGIYISIVFLATAVHAYRFPVAGRFVDSFFGMYICISRL